LRAHDRDHRFEPECDPGRDPLLPGRRAPARAGGRRGGEADREGGGGEGRSASRSSSGMSTRDTVGPAWRAASNPFAGYRPEPFIPAWWLRGAHAQTVGGRQLRRYDAGPLRSERIELPDGDFIDLHEGPEELPEDAPIALVLHGLEGSSGSNYVSTIARELALRGVRALRMNFRACSGEMNRLARFYHAGDTADLDYLVGVLRDRFPGVPLSAVGFSLGGNVLLKYLGEQGDRAREALRSAAVVSVPFDLVAGTRRLEQGAMGR